MVTMYQLGQLAAFLDGIKAGRTSFPGYVLLEIADIVEPMMYKELRELEAQELVKGEQREQSSQTPNKPTPEEVLEMMGKLDRAGTKKLLELQMQKMVNYLMWTKDQPKEPEEKDSAVGYGVLL